MKIAIINKSDSTGGAAVVTRRLLEALREAGHDARMLVAEKLTDSPHVIPVAHGWRLKLPFYAERLDVARANGFDRGSLFAVDPATRGRDLSKIPFVREADAILLNWTNQGLLSLEGLGKLARLGKPVVQTMHDMWAFTGICHHAAQCRGFTLECGDCPLLGSRASRNDLSHKVWRRKKELYDSFPDISFVAVSNWLAERARESSLLKNRRLTVIPNAFSPAAVPPRPLRSPDDRNITIIFGAARLDDPIKGLPVLLEALGILRDKRPDLNIKLLTFGNFKNPHAFDGCPLAVTHLGTIHGEENVAEAYSRADIAVSASRYETLPGTLVEAQAYGAIPVAFDRGGQRDIIEHGVTGFLAERPNDGRLPALRLADELSHAADIVTDDRQHRVFTENMARSAVMKFSPPRIADAYLKYFRF